MNKIKCTSCDYYTENADYAFCRMQDKKIPVNNEKARCKNFEQTDLCWRCLNFLPWVETSTGEINHACVMNEKRIIRRCNQFNHPERCPDYVESFGKTRVRDLDKS